MSDTHPNAFHALADEKRKLAAQFASEANELEAKAHEAEIKLGLAEPDPVAENTEDPVDTGTKPEKSGKLFNK